MKPATLDRVIENLRVMVSPADAVLAAVSGGSDSMAMLVLLAEARKEIPFRLFAAVVNHGLRSGVEDEIALVKQLTERLGIQLLVLSIPPNEAADAAQKSSLQAWARDRRYGLLLETAESIDARFIATGHTRDDQAETVLLRILRGSGIDGISGIPRMRRLGEATCILRPVLDYGRQALREVLQKRNIRFADDPSNENSRFLRVRVRNELLPLMAEMNPGVSQHLAALASDASALVSYAERDIFCGGDIFLPLRLASGLRVRKQTFEALPRALWTRVIRKAVERVQGNLLRIERVHLAAVEALLDRCISTGKIALPEGPSVFVDRGDLLLFPCEIPNKPSGFGRPIAVGAGVWKAGFAALGVTAEIRAKDASLVTEMEIRTRRPGDRLFGSSRKFKEVFLAGKVPRPYRDFVPLMVEGDGVVSCPGLVPSRKPGVTVSWTLDDAAPFLDLDFGIDRCDRLRLP